MRVMLKWQYVTVLYCPVTASGESNYSTDAETHKTNTTTNPNSKPIPVTIIKFGSADQLILVTGKMWMCDFCRCDER